MIRLRAYHPYDASAVLEHEGHLYFAERPFGKNLRLITPAQLDYLLRRMEYVAVDQEFENLATAEEEVYRIASELRHQYPASPLTEEELFAGFEMYSEEMLQFQIEDVRDRFVAAGKFQDADRLISGLWKVQRITTNPRLRGLLIDVDAKIQAALEPLQQLKAQPKLGAFPHLKTEASVQVARLENLAA